MKQSSLDNNIKCCNRLKCRKKETPLIFSRFIMQRSANKAVSFDIETAIRVLRQSGYFKHALYLAELHGKHDWYLRIQLEDSKDYRKALDYMGRLEFDEVEANMRTYGKVLMANVSAETTELLKKLCSNYGTDTNSMGEANWVDLVLIDWLVYVFLFSS